MRRGGVGKGMLQDYLVILGKVMDTLWVREGLLNLILM